MLGEVLLPISYDSVKVTHTFYVVAHVTVNLFGRDLFNAFDFHVVHSPNLYGVSAINVTTDIAAEYSHYFSENFQSNVKEPVKLDVPPDATPVYCKARKVPVRLRDSLKKELDRLESSGIVSKLHTSEWATPVVTVMKKSGALRLCADFSVTLNRFVRPVNCVLPTIDQVISSIGHATVFSKLDLSQAFLQLPIHPDSQKYLVINTPEGLYNFKYLPYGLRASPGIFQSFMCKTLDNIPGVIVYQDDLLLLSADHDSHKALLHSVLGKLREVGLKLNYDKCSFFTNKIDYLGYVFDSAGVRPNPNKFEAIQCAPVPTTVKQVQSFLGLCNFYSRFIPRFAECMSPLYSLVQKKSNSKFVWSEEHQQSFERIKRLFVGNNILNHFHIDYETSIETDASSYGVGAVLLQRPNKDSPWAPVQFASRTLNKAECNYSQIEREGLSVVFAVDKFREFLLGSHFIIFNDHKPLFTLFAKDRPVPLSCSARVQRWALKLSQYDYSFVYSRGSNNVQSDFLSRLPLPHTESVVEPYELVFVIESLDDLVISHKTVREQTERDTDLVELKSFIKHGAPNRITNPALSKYKTHIPFMSLMKGCILFHNRVLIPQNLRASVLATFHENHPGIVAMKSLARSLIWYPGLDRDIESLVKSCKVCQTARSRPPQVHGQWPTPTRPWQRLHIDHFFFEDKICLLVIDALSKYIEVEIVKNVSVQETIDALRLVFSRHGLPDVICSDNATCFSSAQFASFLQHNGIEHVTSPPYSPASNGQAERGVRVIKDLLKKQKQNDSLRNRLSRVLFYYRCVPHNVTQIAPSVALNGRRLISLKDRINPMYSSNKSDNKQMRQFEIGDDVLALNLRNGPKWYKAVIIQKLGTNVYEVSVPELDIIWKRHWNQLSYIPDATDVPTGQSDDQAGIHDVPRRGDRMRKPVIKYGINND